MATKSGSNSVTVSGEAGQQRQLTKVFAGFDGTGPQTGTVQVKDGSTVIWEAAVSGGMMMEWPPVFRPTCTAGEDLTVTLSGGWVRLIYT